MSFEHFKGTIVIIPLLLIISDIAVIDVIIDGFCPFVGVRLLWFLIPISSLKVIPQCRVAVILNSFEFAIGIEAKDRAEDIVNEAEDGISKCELVHPRVCG